MRIAVVSECHVGSAWAHAINVIKTAGGFARLGHEVLMLCREHPERIAPSELLSAYGERDLEVLVAPNSLQGASAFARWAIDTARQHHVEFLYCRHFEAATLAAMERIPAILETHAYVGDRNPALLAALEASAHAPRPLAISTIHPALREYYISAGAAAERVSVIPDGVDVEMFHPPERLPPAPWQDDQPNRPRAVYAGRLFAYKGVDTLVRAAAMLPEWIIEILGGPDEERQRLEGLVGALGIANVRLRGQRALAEVPAWLWHATALVLTPSAAEPSAGWTSPVKLGEYLAAGAPIVASDIPGLRAWVDEPAVRWVAPDDAHETARAVATSATETAERRAARRGAAEQLVSLYSYPRRAERMIEAAVDSRSASEHVDSDSIRTCAGNPK